MAAPSRWIVTIPVAVSRSPIQNGFDPLPQPRGGLRLLAPDGIKRLHHKPCIDRLHRERPKEGVCVRLKGSAPLLGVLRVAPACFMRVDVSSGALREGD